ncbi:hypothetical protein A1D31_39730 [Bradyrhizobium liaoningense]|nr:hypothetical protein A1D31_39730 [Bradyrhizobium liaoningense]
MHLALASNEDLGDFAPEPTKPEDVQRWIDDVIARAERVFGTLAQRRETLKEADRPLADQLLAQETSLPERLKALLPRDIGGFNIRHHGDFHLGQMLIVKDDIFIIDFAGAPRQSIAARRRKAPAARDVAGLIRSIDYAAMVAFERALRKWPEEHARLLDALDDWSRQSIDTFMASYRGTLTNQNLWPALRAKADRLLDFFLLEKAFDEVNYELQNRPRFLGVPLLALHKILTKRLSPFSRQA